MHRLDLAGQLVAHAGAQPQTHQPRQRQTAARALRQAGKHVRTGLAQKVRRFQQLHTGRRQTGPAATATADRLFDQRRAGQVAEGFQGLPCGLVAHVGAAGGLGDGAQFADALQDIEALVRRFVSESLGKLQSVGLIHGPKAEGFRYTRKE